MLGNPTSITYRRAVCRRFLRKDSSKQRLTSIVYLRPTALLFAFPHRLQRRRIPIYSTLRPQLTPSARPFGKVNWSRLKAPPIRERQKKSCSKNSVQRGSKQARTTF